MKTTSLAASFIVTICMLTAGCGNKKKNNDDTPKESAPSFDASVVSKTTGTGCDAVVEHIFAIEEKEMAPATFDDPAARKQMMAADCQKFGLAAGEAECILKAASQDDLNKCRPKERTTEPAPSAPSPAGANPGAAGGAAEPAPTSP